MKDILRAFVLMLIALILLLLLRCGAAVERGRKLELTPVPLPLGTATRTVTPRPPTRVPTPRPRRPTPVPTAAPVAALPSPVPTPVPAPRGLASIQGVVRHYKAGSPDIVPYPNAQVLGLSAGRVAARAVTDGSGSFALNGLADGAYSLQVIVQTAYPFTTQALMISAGRSLFGQTVMLEEEFEPDTVSVGFQPGLTDAQMDAAMAEYGAVIRQRIPDKNKYGVKIPPGVTVPEMIERLKKDRRVSGATPNYYVVWRR